MRLNIPNLPLILTIIFGYIGQIYGENMVNSKSVSIVNFRSKKNWREWNESPKAITNEFFATKDITVCFRYMTYMNEDLMVLVETFQIKIMFKKKCWICIP